VLLLMAFTLAVICGTVGWVTIATVTWLPVSTTHAIIESLLGAGLWFAPTAIAWSSLAPRLAVPLLLVWFEHHSEIVAHDDMRAESSCFGYEVSKGRIEFRGAACDVNCGNTKFLHHGYRGVGLSGCDGRAG